MAAARPLNGSVMVGSPVSGTQLLRRLFGRVLKHLDCSLVNFLQQTA